MIVPLKDSFLKSLLTKDLLRSLFIKHFELNLWKYFQHPYSERTDYKKSAWEEAFQLKCTILDKKITSIELQAGKVSF